MKRWFCGTMLFFLLLTLLPLQSQAADISAASAIVIEASSRTPLYEKDSHTRRPPASTTKIVTALLAIERADPKQMLTVSSRAAEVEGSQLGLQEGDQLSLQDLLHILLMKSGNDAAITIAENLAGSIEIFAEWMNRKAEEFGLKNTHFTNPHGLPDDNHYTTAYDLAILAAKAMENELFREIVQKTKTKLEYKGLVLSNSNKLLYNCPGACGIKTGFTKKAGRCLVSAAERDNVTLICVTLSAPDDWNDHRALYDICFPRVERYEVLAAGQYKTTQPALNAKNPILLTNASPLYGIRIDGQPVPFSSEEYLPAVLFAPVRKGQVVGSIALTQNSFILSRAYLYAVEDVEEKYGDQTGTGLFSVYLEQLWNKLIFRRTVF